MTVQTLHLIWCVKPQDVADLRDRGAARTHHVPTAQPTRSRHDCRCGGPCFYCGDPLDGPHDHDHFPLAWRHGGRHTVPACRRCHKLKNYRGFHSWSPSALQSAAGGLSRSAVIAVALWLSCIEAGKAPADTADEVAALVEELAAECTTAEARITVPAVANLVLDQERETA